MLERLSKKIGLTLTELKISFFIIFIFLLGLTYNTFFDKKGDIPYQIFDYSEEDEKFYSNYGDSLKFNPQKSSEKEVDYKQEVLDFNSQGFDNIQKKILPAEKSINLNTAELKDLVNLPGIGEKTAQSIIDYRVKHKRFKSIDELLYVKGIGEAKFAKIKKYVFIE